MITLHLFKCLICTGGSKLKGKYLFVSTLRVLCYLADKLENTYDWVFSCFLGNSHPQTLYSSFLFPFLLSICSVTCVVAVVNGKTTNRQPPLLRACFFLCRCTNILTSTKTYPEEVYLLGHLFLNLNFLITPHLTQVMYKSSTNLVALIKMNFHVSDKCKVCIKW